MHYKQESKIQKGFTLIELLIVILIISLVYYFGFSGFSTAKNQPKALTPQNLKSTIPRTKLFSGHATLLCVDKCTKCYLRQDINSVFQPYSNSIDLTGTTAYTVNNDDDIEEIEYGRFNDLPICLVIDFYDNGSSTPIILKQDEKVYFLPSFFGEAKTFSSLEDAKEYWLRNSKKVADKGDYY